MLPVPVTIHFNGRRIHAERRYVLRNPVLVAPLRQLFVLLGFKVKWTSNDEDIIVTKDTASLTFRISTSVFHRNVDGFITRDIRLGGSARLEGAGMDARTVIPLMAPLSALGYRIDARPNFGQRHTEYHVFESDTFYPELPLPSMPHTNPKYVLLEYIVEKNNGSMALIPPFYTDPNRRVYWITMRGVSRPYVVGEHIYCQNGYLIVEQSRLEEDFGLSERRATHQSWDRFKSSTSAALAFSLMWTQHGTDIDREMGALIYRFGVGPPWNRRTYFTFGNEWEGAQDNVVLGMVRRFVFPEIRAVLGLMSIVALAHTHPAGGDVFSIEDRDLAHGLFEVGRHVGWLDWMGDVRIPRLNVYMSVIMDETRLEVRRFDNTFDRRAFSDRQGREIFIR